MHTIDRLHYLDGRWSYRWRIHEKGSLPLLVGFEPVISSTRGERLNSPSPRDNTRTPLHYTFTVY